LVPLAGFRGIIRLPADQAGSRIPTAEKSPFDPGFFGEFVSGIPKGSTGNRIKAMDGPNKPGHGGAGQFHPPLL
jgi:hypothetical protein